MNLQLSLKKQWFELTKSGVKREDYREITPYWAKRLLLYKKEPLSESLTNIEIEDVCSVLSKCYDKADLEFEIDNFYISFKNFDSNIMTLGYPKSAYSERILKLEHKGIEIREGNPDWGAEKGKLYFVIKHGNIIKKQMNLEKYKKANIATNMAYSVAEAANSFAVDAESELRKIGSCLKHEEKHKFKLMIESAEKLKNTSKFVAKPLYGIPDSEMALSDSDWLYMFLKLLIDRVGSNVNKMEMVSKYVHEMDSELNFFNK